MSKRRYVVFGSADKVNWEILNTVEASGDDQAKKQAHDMGTGHTHFACTPERNWSTGTPKVKHREPIVTWESLTPGQMSVDEVMEVMEKQKQAPPSREPETVPLTPPEEEKASKREGVL